MKFLVNKNFLKSVPEDMAPVISEKITDFSKLLNENKSELFNMPKGFWVKKIKQGNDEFFEFRVNSGDRVIFDLIKRDKTNFLRYLYYSKHDRALDKYEKLKKDNFKDFGIEKKTIEQEIGEEIGKPLYWNQDINIIDYKVENEEFFKKIMENPDDSLLYCLFLNDEQHQCLEKNPPVIISGGAGSGKTAVLFNKMISMEKNSEALGKPKIAYLTLSNRLKDGVQGLMREATKNSSTISFFSIGEFFREIFAVQEENFAEFDDFKKFFSLNLNRGKKKNKKTLQLGNIYSEINGVIKGMMFKDDLSNWNRDISSPMITLDEYLSLKDQFSIYGEEERREIYKIAENYQNWLKAEKKFDLNDLCLLYLKNSAEGTFDYLFIDEVQDLTELQIFTLSSLCKDRSKIFFAGDLHQVVTMNHFNFSRLSDLYKNNSHELNFLSKNYRSKSKIIDAANRVKELRKKYIGSLDLEHELPEEAIIQGGNFSIIKNNINYLKSVAKDGFDYIIVVPNIEEKKSLVSDLENSSDLGDMIFTVEEAKGLEFKNVICYNLTTPFSQEWNLILNGKTKKNQNYRYYFNLLYVGITRAKSNVQLMEKEIVKNRILSEFKDLFESNQNTLLKLNSATAEDWEKRATQLISFGKVKEAEVSMKKAVNIKESEKIKTDITKDKLNIIEEETPKIVKIYYSNKKLKSEETFIKEKKEGLHKFYYKNGGLEQEINYKEGKKEGITKIYYQNGQLKCEENYKIGKLVGNSKIYYENGQLKSQKDYKNDQQEYFQRIYYRTGQLQIEAHFKNGQPDGTTKCYKENRKLDYEINYKNGKQEGITKLYYEDGQLSSEVNFKDGRQDGITKCYYENGQLKEIGNFEKDLQVGITKSYYINGKLREKAPFKNGKKDGIAKGYYENGKLKHEISYKNDLQNGITKCYYENGKLHKEENLKDGKKDGLSKKYYKNGNLENVISFKNGNLDGLTKKYYENGNLEHEINFKNDQQIGDFKEYYKNGKIKD